MKVLNPNSRVILCPTLSRSGTLSIAPAKHSLSLQTVRQGLIERGVKDVHLFPSAECHLLNLSHVDMLRRSAAELTDTSAPVVVGISSTSPSHWPVALKIAGLFRDIAPEATIVGGGHHFRREANLIDFRGQHPDTIELAVRYLFDLAIDGGAQSFIDLFASETRSLPGVYYLDEAGQVVGYGQSAHPNLEQLPFVVGQRDIRVGLNLNPGCVNECDFCADNFPAPSFSQAAKADVLQRAQHAFDVFEDGYPNLSFKESNPLATVAKTRRFFALLDECEARPHRPLLKDIFLEPSSLIGRDIEDLAAQLVKRGFWAFFIGRDTVDGEIARKIGRKRLGKVKDQSLLDAEREALRQFIFALRKFKALNHPRNLVQLSNIVTPFETRASALQLFADMQEFRRLSNENLEVRSDFGCLTPYPGTAIKRRYLEWQVNPADMRLMMDSANPWSDRMGAGSALIDHLFEFQRQQALGQRLERSAEEIVELVFAGELLPVADKDKPARAVSILDQIEQQKHTTREAFIDAVLLEPFRAPTPGELIMAAAREERKGPLIIDCSQPPKPLKLDDFW